MKITTGIKVMACSLLLNSCSNQTNTQRVLREIYPNGTTRTVLREVANKSRASIDSTYHFFGRDTLSLGNNYKLNADKILKKINNHANNKAVIKKIGLKKSSSSNKYESIDLKLYDNAKGVIKSDKVYKSQTGSIYIPVEYYGKN